MLNQNVYQIFDIYKLIKKAINRIVGSVLFFLENYRKRYPYVLVGEKPSSSSKESILYYRAVGKRHVYEKTAKELCNEKDLIKKFHPLDVRTISFIAGVELILDIPPEERADKFKLLKEKIFRKF